MRIGNLRYIVEVYQKTITKNEYGEETEVWNLHMTLRAEKKELTATKTLSNKEIFNSKIILFVTYYRVNIDETMRIKFKNVDYKINSIKEVGYKEGLEIEVEKINV